MFDPKNSSKINGTSEKMLLGVHDNPKSQRSMQLHPPNPKYRCSQGCVTTPNPKNQCSRGCVTTFIPKIDAVGDACNPKSQKSMQLGMRATPNPKNRCSWGCMQPKIQKKSMQLGMRATQNPKNRCSWGDLAIRNPKVDAVRDS